MWEISDESWSSFIHAVSRVPILYYYCRSDMLGSRAFSPTQYVHDATPCDVALLEANLTKLILHDICRSSSRGD